MATPSILVAEDDAQLREAIAWSLRAAGYRTVTASDGLDALRILRAGDVGLLVIDMRMPWMTGLDVVAHMRRERALQRIPVVVLTAYPGDVPGDLVVIEKPFSADRLVQTVSAIAGEGPLRHSGRAGRAPGTRRAGGPRA